jgi:hypothetical protein
MQSAASKGLFAGPVRLICRDGNVVQGTAAGADWQGSLIPPGEQVLRVEVEDNVSDIIVIEKHAVFHTLLQARLDPDVRSRPLRRSVLITVRLSCHLCREAGVANFNAWRFGSRAKDIRTLPRGSSWLGWPTSCQGVCTATSAPVTCPCVRGSGSGSEFVRLGGDRA